MEQILRNSSKLPIVGSPRSNLDWSGQLLALKDMTKRFNCLHEGQALQFRLMPFAVDPSLDKSEAAIDFETKVVTFTWTGSALDYDSKDYRTRLLGLEEHVRFMLGDEWNVDVISDGLKILPLLPKRTLLQSILNPFKPKKNIAK